MCYKRLLLGMSFLFGSFSCFAELPICPKNCDSHWQACIQSCVSGPDGSDKWRCQTKCGEQHESCLIACKSSISPTQKLGSRPASGKDED